MLDYFIAGRGLLIFLELKLKSSRDKLSKGQVDLIKKINDSPYATVGIIDEDNYKQIQEYISSRKDLVLRVLLLESLEKHKVFLYGNKTDRT